MGARIVADDYGMSVDINRAIADLTARNIISKISVMANASFQYSSAGIEKAETGLHLDILSFIKDPSTNSFKSVTPSRLLFLVFTNKLTTDHVMDAIKHQHDILKLKGITASYLDTHKHAHILPQILDPIISYAKSSGIRSIRCLTMKRGYFIHYLRSLIKYGFSTQLPKMILLYSLGVLMRMKLDKHDIHYCENLLLMPLADGGDYQGLLMHLLTRFKNEDVEIVTHPGLETDDAGMDDYSKGRYVEYTSLLGL